MSGPVDQARLSRRDFGKLSAGILAAAGPLSLAGAEVAAQDDPTPTPDVTTSGSGETQLSFLSVVSTSSPAGQARLRVLDKFTQENPGVSINYEGIPYDQFFSQLVTRTLAGDAPEIAQDGHHTAQFAANNALVAFDDYLQRDGMSKESFWPALWELGDFAGKTWSMPFTIDTRYNYSNQTLYDQMGLEIPDTWDQMLIAGQAAKAAGLAGAFGLSMGAEIAGFWETSSHLGKTNAAEFLLVDESSKATSNMSSPEVMETVDFLIQVIDQGVVPDGSLSLSGSELQSLFSTKQMASFCTGNWMIPVFAQSLADGDMDFDPVLTHLPMKKQRGANAGGWAWYVFNTIDDPDLGWNLVKFFLQDENVNEGWPDSLPPGSDQLALPLYADNPRYEFVSEVLSYSTWPIPPVAGYFEIMPVMWRAIVSAINGQASVADAMKSGDEEVQRLLDSGHNMLVGM